MIPHMPERKALTGLKVTDEATGTVQAVFATLSVIDKDGDVTLPGEFRDGQKVKISAYNAERLIGELGRLDGNLPLGAIVATAVLDRCSEMTRQSIATLADRDPHEYAFGLYAPGRFAWVLRDVDHLTEAVPFAWSVGPRPFDDIADELVTRL